MRELPAVLYEQLRREAFSLGGAPSRAPRIGAEVELLPFDASGRIAAIAGGESATQPVLRTLSARLGWRESRSAKADVPEYHTPRGGRLTFEPGGQIEYAAPPNESLSALLADVHGVTTALREWLAPAEITLVAAGIDPVNPIEDVPMQLSGERYRRMDAHFAALGPFGARMMRQTASIQVSLDAGDDPLSRWTLLNALAPYLVAVFANSPVYAGDVTGHQSYRRHVWGALDTGRTGLPWDADDPIAAYGRFAMGAGDILFGEDPPPYGSFTDTWARGAVGLDQWRAHLTTLFPEVRPRGYFEVRSIDALDPIWYAAPLAFVAGLVLDPATARTASELVGAPDAALLVRAGRCGVEDHRIAAVARELSELALQGCAALGTRFIAPRDLDVARAFFARYTARGSAPAFDMLTETTV